MSRRLQPLPVAGFLFFLIGFTVWELHGVATDDRGDTLSEMVWALLEWAPWLTIPFGVALTGFAIWLIPHFVKKRRSKHDLEPGTDPDLGSGTGADSAGGVVRPGLDDGAAGNGAGGISGGDGVDNPDPGEPSG